MRVPQMVSEFLEWRWAPCVGLTAGSLAFVALAILLIPTRFGEPRVPATLTSFDSPRPQRALYGSSLARSLAEPQRELETAGVSRSAPPSSRQITETGAPPQRGFSPILDRPEPPPPPSVVAPAVPPVPAPGSVLVTQPEPGGPSRESIVQ